MNVHAFHIGSVRSKRIAVSWILLACTGAGGCDDAARSYPQRDGGVVAVGVPEGGAVQIGATANNCPVVTFAVSPPDGRIGDALSVIATASDPDNDDVSLVWSATAGIFSDPKGSTGTYTCSVGGPQTLTLVASDTRCTVTRKAQVICYVQDAGVPADAAVDGRLDTGGSGGAVGSAATGGANGGGATGGSGGSPAAGGSGGSSMGTGAGGAMQSGGGNLPIIAECDPTDPTKDECPYCNLCTFGGVSKGGVPVYGNCDREIADCNGLDDAQKTACVNLYKCMRDTGCVAVAGGAEACYCGVSGDPACLSHGRLGNGPCVKEMEAAAMSSDPNIVYLHLIDPALAIGRAIILMDCRLQYCGAPASATDVTTLESPSGNVTIPAFACRTGARTP